MIQGNNILYIRIILMGNCIKKIFPLNKKFQILMKNWMKKIKNNVECIICFHYLEDDEISLPCMINNCTINAHQRCIKELIFKEKNVVPFVMKNGLKYTVKLVLLNY